MLFNLQGDELHKLYAGSAGRGGITEELGVSDE
jgi:hypothetical protein